MSQISQYRKLSQGPALIWQASPSSLLVQASCGGQAPLHQCLLLAALKKLSRDLITPLQADCCMQSATHTRPKANSVTYLIQLSNHSVSLIWYVTTVMLVNRISLMSHRCDIFCLFSQLLILHLFLMIFLLWGCLQLNMAASLSYVPPNENNSLPCAGCETAPPPPHPKKKKKHMITFRTLTDKEERIQNVHL